MAGAHTVQVILSPTSQVNNFVIFAFHKLEKMFSPEPTLRATFVPIEKTRKAVSKVMRTCVLDMFMGFQHFAQNKVGSRLQKRLPACVKLHPLSHTPHPAATP